jgi:hypothetical protein
MQLQMKWQHCMKPVCSMLNFDLHSPVWARQTMNECHLVVPQNAGVKEDDHTSYEEQMFTQTRTGGWSTSRTTWLALLIGSATAETALQK